MEIRFNSWRAPGIAVAMSILLGGGAGITGAKIASPDVARFDATIVGMERQLGRIEKATDDTAEWRAQITATLASQVALMASLQNQMRDAASDVRRHESELARLQAEREAREQNNPQRRR